MTKNNIAAANRLVISTKGRSNIRQRDVIDAATKTYNKNIVSNVPYTVRLSYAYKRKNFLDLQTVFNNLGAPQLFFTFSCNDYSPDFTAATGTQYPWEDPVLFANHFNRKWNHFFNTYVLGHFAKMIGDVKDFSWVLEIQDRGSPHIHCVLWTEKSLQELVRFNVITCKLLPRRAADDPLLHDLILKHQTHICNPVYCKLGENRTCCFGYPKQAAPRTEFVGGSCIYERRVEDMNINNYNSYLLAVWRANMDIQYNCNDFDSMSEEPEFFLAHDTYNAGSKNSATRALNESRLLQELKLKTDMPVMLIQNLHVSSGWVNGTIAQVKEIDEETVLLSKEGPDGDELTLWIQKISRSVPETSYLRSQFSIVPAFASTIHKAQRTTIDSVAIYLDDMIAHGQLYVAMSRIRKSENLYFFGAELPLRIKRK
ncbi:ATP-dependent DNA helicase pif1 [Choanephora cucurbitarum]|uniref:ATP-dependent DNA helicase pif1 n=1 Tax=Choanephora cucurbitarum TaxID=101091 RepID=A0A1C7N4M5_9FUNG|nr:ATP-dependent DNA helicase pif1 [Choanephora cucurbitarum]